MVQFARPTPGRRRSAGPGSREHGAFALPGWMPNACSLWWPHSPNCATTLFLHRPVNVIAFATRDDEDEEPSHHGDASARAGGAAVPSSAAGGSTAPGHRRPAVAGPAAPAGARLTVAYDDDAANRADLFGKRSRRTTSCLPNAAPFLPRLPRLAVCALHRVSPLLCHICAGVQAARRLPGPPHGCSPIHPAEAEAAPPRAPAPSPSPARAPRTRSSGRTAGNRVPPPHGEAEHGLCTCIGICRRCYCT